MVNDNPRGRTRQIQGPGLAILQDRKTDERELMGFAIKLDACRHDLNTCVPGHHDAVSASRGENLSHRVLGAPISTLVNIPAGAHRRRSRCPLRTENRTVTKLLVWVLKPTNNLLIGIKKAVANDVLHCSVIVNFGSCREARESLVRCSKTVDSDDETGTKTGPKNALPGTKCRFSL